MIAANPVRAYRDRRSQRGPVAGTPLCRAQRSRPTMPTFMPPLPARTADDSGEIPTTPRQRDQSPKDRLWAASIVLTVLAAIAFPLAIAGSLTIAIHHVDADYIGPIWVPAALLIL